MIKPPSKDRKRPGRKKPEAGAKDPLVQARQDKIRQLVNRFSMPLDLARKVAGNEQSMSEALKIMQLREVVDKHVSAGLISVHEKPLVLKGDLSLEEASFRHQLRSLKKTEEYVSSWLRPGVVPEDRFVVAVLGGGLVKGRLVETSVFNIVIETDEGTVELPKHDIKFFFADEDRKKLMKKVIAWGESSARLTPEHLRSRNIRIDIKAKVLLRKMIEGAVISWTTVEDDVLKGKLTWVGAFELRLVTTKGPEVFLMRHAFKALD